MLESNLHKVLLVEQARLGSPAHHADATGRGMATRMRGGCSARDTLLPLCKSKAEALVARLSRRVDGQQCCTMPQLFQNISHAHGFASSLLQISMSIHALKDGHIRGAAVFLREERGGQEAFCCGKDGLRKGNCTRGKVFPPTLWGCTTISISLWDAGAPIFSIAPIQAIVKSGKCC